MQGYTTYMRTESVRNVFADRAGETKAPVDQSFYLRRRRDLNPDSAGGLG
jgi:hypothetical protein